MAVLRYFHQDPKQTSVQESSIVDRQGTVLTQKLTNINQSISNNTQAIDDKQNSIPGKSLSTNDFTDEYKDKLRGIEERAEVNVQSDWGEDDDTADSYIKNKPESLPASDVYEWAKQPTKPVYTDDEIIGLSTNYIPVSQKGVYGGVATLGANDGKVPESQLPSYVDDVLEYTNRSKFPSVGESGKIYVDITTNLTYRWTGTQYTEISPSIALGETSSTAYAGDKGKRLADAINDTQNYDDTLDWNTAIAIARVNGIEITAKLPSNPNTWRPISDSVTTTSSTISASLTAVKAAYDLAASKTSNTGTVTSVGLTVPTGLSVSGSPITTKGTLAITLAKGYSIPTTAKQDTWDAKQDAISDLSTIRSNASHGETAYGWGNHALAGYQPAISDLSTIRSNASEGHTAYGWGDHSKAGYVKSSGVTSVAMTVPTGLAISGSPITSTGTLALSFANGYSIPTTAKQGNWDTAYSWGNHANAGYVKSSGVTKISTTDGVVGGDITTTGTIKANLASYTKNTSNIGGKLYAVQLDKSGRLAVDVPWVNTWTAWKGATSSAAGTAGYMPAPTKDQYHQFLRGDGTWVSLNNYSLPLAASGTRGGVQIGFTTDAANRNYAVQLSGEKMYVNVPWTDNNTTYPLAIKDISRSGTTFTATRYDGTTFTFTQQDNNTTYSAGTGLSLNGTKFSLALTKALVTDALGYTPPTQDTNTTYSAGPGLSLSGTTFSLALTKALVTTALGYTPPTQDTNTWKPANTSQEGYAPKLTTGGGTIATQASEYVLTFKNGTDTAPVWRLLPANAYLNNTYTVNNGTLNLQASGTTKTTFTANQSGTSTFNIATGSANGTISVGGADVAVKGLGNRAYDSTSYLPLSGGTMTGTANINWADSGNYGSGGEIIYPVVRGGLRWVGQGDYCYLYSEETARDNLDLVLRFGDDNSNGLSIRNKDNRATGRISATGTFTATKLVKHGGTSSQFLKADGSVDSNSYLTGITKTMVTNALGYTPPTSDTNNAVTQTNTTTNAFYRLLFSGTADDTNRTEGARKNTNIKVNPSYGGVHANGFFHNSASLSDTWTDSCNKKHPWYGIDFRRESGNNYFHSVYSDYFGMCFRTCFIKIAVGDFSAGAAVQARTIYINNAINTDPIIFSVAGTISAENRLLAPNTYTTYIDGRGSDEGGPGPLYIQCNRDEPVVIASGSQLVGIGKNPTQGKVDINGVCHASQFMPNSDLRLKDIQSNMSINLKDIAEAPVFLFKWKDKNIDNLAHVGTSAQYWKEKVPELVSEANDDIKTLSLDYSALSVASNVTLAKEVVSLKEEIKLLQAQIAELKQLLNN